MKARSVTLAGAIVALGVASGCVVKVDFDPVGSDFAINGSWTVNGQPASAATCGDIETVRLVFFDGGSPFFYDELSAPCEAGGFATAQIWAYGNYQTEWWAERSDGSVIKDVRMPLVVSSPITTANTSWDIPATPGGFDPLGSDDSLSADWTINGVAPDIASCGAAGIANIEITLYAEDDTGYTDGVTVASAPCESGKYDSRDPGEPGAIIANGRYLTSIDAVSGTGEVLGSFRFPDPLDTNAVTHAMLATADFATPTTLAINFGWDTDPTGVMADGTCTDAGVMTYSYMLNVMGGALVGEEADIACADRLVFEDITPGTYSIYIEGADASGVKRWMVTCTDLMVNDGELAEYNCAVSDTSGM